MKPSNPEKLYVNIFIALDFVLYRLPLVGVDLWARPLCTGGYLWATSVAMYNVVFKFVLFIKNKTERATVKLEWDWI